MGDLFARYVVRPEPIQHLLHHEMAAVAQQVGVAYRYMDAEMVAGADLVVHVRKVDGVPPGLPSFVDPHRHDVSHFYGLVGDLTVHLQLNDEEGEVTGPAGIFIPPGVVHRLQLARGNGYLIVILRQARYE